MKLTNEDLRRIILEELEAVLSEDEHPAIASNDDKFIDDEEEDPRNPDPAQPHVVARKIKELGANLPKKKVDPRQMAFFNQKLEKAVDDLDDDDLAKQRALADATKKVDDRFEKK